MNIRANCRAVDGTLHVGEVMYSVIGPYFSAPTPFFATDWRNSRCRSSHKLPGTLPPLSNLKMGSPGVAYRRLELRRRGFRGEFLLYSSIRFVDLPSLSRIDSFSLCDSCGDTASKWNPQIEAASLLVVT